jgi:hypothetical protein
MSHSSSAPSQLVPEVQPEISQPHRGWLKPPQKHSVLTGRWKGLLFGSTLLQDDAFFGLNQTLGVWLISIVAPRLATASGKSG